MSSEILRPQAPPPEPRSPYNSPLRLLLFGFIMLAISEAYRSQYVLAGVCALIALLTLLAYRDDLKAYRRDHPLWRMHDIEWKLRFARDWVAYFERRKQEGPPWYDDDPGYFDEHVDSCLENARANCASFEGELRALALAPPTPADGYVRPDGKARAFPPKDKTKKMLLWLYVLCMFGGVLWLVFGYLLPNKPVEACGVVRTIKDHPGVTIRRPCPGEPELYGERREVPGKSWRKLHIPRDEHD